MLGAKTGKRAGKAKAMGLFAGTPAAPAKGSRQTKNGAFASAIASKTEDAGALEKLQSRLGAALKKLQDNGAAEAGTLEKARKDVMADRTLGPKQKAAKLSSVLADAEARAAQLAVPNPTAIKTMKAEPPAQEKKAEKTAAVEKKRVTEPSIKVVDLRKQTAEATGIDAKDAAKADILRAVSADAVAVSADGGPSAPARPARTAGKTESAPVNGSGQTPLERLREMAGSELVKHAGMILRNGGGEIRLVLKPESLGSLRLRLNLTETVIEGKIIVDNPAVKHVLEASLDSLTRALSAEGFQTASLQVSVSGGGADADGGRQEAAPVPRARAVQGLSGMVPDLDAMSAWDDLLVNVFA